MIHSAGSRQVALQPRKLVVARQSLEVSGNPRKAAPFLPLNTNYPLSFHSAKRPLYDANPQFRTSFGYILACDLALLRLHTKQAK
jgi:hypothetical protein